MLESKELPKPRIDGSRTSYDHQHAYACAIAAWMAYFQGRELAEYCKDFGLTVIAEIDRPPDFCVVLGGPGFRIVAFRGTDERADWWTNLLFVPKKTPWGRVHKGFQSSTDSLWPDVVEHIRDAGERQVSLWIAGHSLGGAMAMLAAARLMTEGETLIHGIYTYGQPPAGYVGFARRFKRELNDRYFRFVNHRDPGAIVGVGSASHAGQLRYFDIYGTLHYNNCFFAELRDCMLLYWRRGLFSEYKAHSIEHYVSLIEGLIANEASDA
jgi:triacylglycerol lipase